MENNGIEGQCHFFKWIWLIFLPPNSSCDEAHAGSVFVDFVLDYLIFFQYCISIHKYMGTHIYRNIHGCIKIYVDQQYLIKPCSSVYTHSDIYAFRSISMEDLTWGVSKLYPLLCCITINNLRKSLLNSATKLL